jgi:hypothetical protein
MPWIHNQGGVVCGEFLDESIRASEASRTKTNGVAKRGQRAALGPPSGAAESKAPQGTRSEGSRGDLSGGILKGLEGAQGLLRTLPCSK